MKRTLTTMAAAAAVWGLVALPATAQSSGSAGSDSSQQGGSSSGSGATDQQGSTQGDQVGSGGAATSGSGQTTGTSGQSGTGQSGTGSGTQAGSGQSGATKGGVNPGSQGRSTAATSGKASAQDRTFINEAAAGGMAEVELGRLASQKASRSEVKEFGQMMVDDHSKANEQLMKIAKQQGVTPAAALKPQDKATQDRLSKLSGEAFDRAYMDHMVKDHQKDVALFRKHSTSGTDADVKQFASSTLPTLEKHLKRAQEIEQIVGGGSGTARGTSGNSSGTAANARGKAHKGTTGATGSKGTRHGSGSGAGTGSGSGTSGSGTTPPR